MYSATSHQVCRGAMANRGERRPRAGWAAVLAVLLAGPAAAQPAAGTADGPPPLYAVLQRLSYNRPADPPDPPPGLLTAGGVAVPLGAPAGCADGSCRGGTGCVPGRPGCHPDEAPPDTAFGRLAAAVRDGICCPDPCYRPRWTSLANAAVFADTVRPATLTRLRWDRRGDVRTPDRGAFLLARSDGRGRGLRPYPGFRSPGDADVNELVLSTEAGTDRFVATFDLPYRSLRADAAGGGAGFGDLAIGTKALLFDGPRLQLAYTFRTHLPTGNAGKGLGTGHVALEPGVLAGVAVSAETALQAQLAERIPIAGEPGYSGGVLRYHLSVNHVLARPAADVQLIGTLELNGWSFHSGSFTDPAFGPTGTAGVTIVSAGPGLRLAFCDTFDLGVGTAFALTEPRWARFESRFEVRYRY